jgi:RNA-dependent RNA polymerase
VFQFQVRIGGCKGVIVLNPFDEGVKLCLRDSMKKYDIPQSKQVTIEVARAFVGPTKMYLNRLVILVLVLSSNLNFSLEGP